MSAGQPSFFDDCEDGLRLFIRLTPKASRDAVDGVKTADDGRVHLAARVRAVPEDGKANKALEILVAKTLGVPKSAISVIAGHTSRLKTLHVACDAQERDALSQKLKQLT